MLNGFFCEVNTITTIIPLFLMNNIKLGGIPTKNKIKTICLFYIFFSQILKPLLMKNYKIQLATSSFISCCFTSDFLLVDINFYNFLELH